MSNKYFEKFKTNHKKNPKKKIKKNFSVNIVSIMTPLSNILWENRKIKRDIVHIPVVSRASRNRIFRKIQNIRSALTRLDERKNDTKKLENF